MTRDPDYVWKRIRRLQHALNTEVFGKHWRRFGAGVPTFAVIEKQARGALHAHSLHVTRSRRRPKGVRRNWMHDLWFQVWGLGQARILPVGRGAVTKVAGYVSKDVRYVTKGNRGAENWQVWGGSWESGNGGGPCRGPELTTVLRKAELVGYVIDDHGKAVPQVQRTLRSAAGELVGQR